MAGARNDADTQIGQGTSIADIVRARRTPRVVVSNDVDNVTVDTNRSNCEIGPQSYDDLNNDERIAYGRLSAELSKFDLKICGYSYDMFKRPDSTRIVADLRTAGFKVPDVKVEEPELRQYLVVEVTPNARARDDESCSGHDYSLKARFHSGLSRFMGLSKPMSERAIPLNDESRLLGSRETSTYLYKFGQVNVNVLYKK